VATNIFMKFEADSEFKGSSTSKGHEGEVELLSWSHGFSQPTSPVRSSGGGGTKEQAHHQNLTFSKYVDSATDNLLKFCWTGTHIKKVTLTCYRASGDTGSDQMGVPYLKIEMETVIVSNISVGGSGGDLPLETISLDYAKVTYTYTEQSHETGQTGGNLPVSHDLTTHVVA